MKASIIRSGTACTEQHCVSTITPIDCFLLLFLLLQLQLQQNSSIILPIPLSPSLRPIVQLDTIDLFTLITFSGHLHTFTHSVIQPFIRLQRQRRRSRDTLIYLQSIVFLSTFLLLSSLLLPNAGSAPSDRRACIVQVSARPPPPPPFLNRTLAKLTLLARLNHGAMPQK